MNPKLSDHKTDRNDDHCSNLLALYRTSLTNIVRHLPLPQILTQIITGIEVQFPQTMGAIFVMSDAGKPMEIVTAPSLPQDFLSTISTIVIDEDFVDHRCNVDSGDSSDTRASEYKKVDLGIASSVFWSQLQVLAVQHDLRIDASVPIVNVQPRLLGILVLFSQRGEASTARDGTIFTELVSLVAIAIERHQDQLKLLHAEQAARHSEVSLSRMALAIEGSATGVWDRNLQTGEIHYSSGWKALIGYADAEVSNRIEDSYLRVHPDDLAYVQASIRAHFEGKTDSYSVEHRLCCKNGSYIWVASRGKIVQRDLDGRPLHMMGTTTDITTMHVLSDRLQQSVDLVTCLTNEVPGLAYQYQRLANGTERFSYVSEGIKDIYELLPDQMSDAVALVSQLIHPEDLALYQACIAASAQNLQPLHLEFRVNLPQQGLCWRQMDARPRRLLDGGTLWHGFVTDVTEHKRIEMELQEHATIDFLTQIPNRRYFMGRMEEELARLQRAATKPSAVLMFDLDHFKNINDRHGHAAGDMVLKHFANILRDELRKNDVAGRVGGEEFAVVLSGADVEDANIFAQRVQKQLLETPVKANNQMIPVTVSIGIAMMSDTDTSPDASLSRSDMALYRAKEGGRNRITIAAQ